MPYIGNQHNVGDHVNNFKVLDDISSHTATFDGSASSVVDTTNNTIRVPLHRFIQGQRVTYTNGGGGNILGLTSGTAYFVSFDSANTIKLATTLANANSNTVINLSAVGTGTSHTLNAAFDGVNTKFKLTHSSGKAARLNNATQINVAINNVIQRPNQNALSFSEGFALEDNHKIVFKTAPTVSDIFWGSIIANTIENFDLRDNEVDNFTGDGSTTEFTLSTIPANNESVIVSINGVVQHPSDKNTSRSYKLINSIIQFTAAPALNDEIQVRHIGFAGASTNDVSGFYGRTGNVALTSDDHITVGDIPTVRNINASGIITASSFDGSFSSNVGGSNANFTGIVTAGVFKGGDFDGRNLNISGIATFAGDVSIGGTLTYEDVTNIDSVGIITARKDIHVGAGVSAVGIITGQFLMASGGSDANKQNVKIGWMQSENLSTGGYNVLVGRRAGEDVNTGGSLVLIGANAGQKLTNQNSTVIIGGAAGNNATGDGNVYIGRSVAQYSTSANSNVIIGTYAGIDNQGNENTLIGYYSGRGTSGNTDGTRNTFVGAQSGFKIQGGDDNTSVGRYSLRELLGGNKNVAIGQQAGDALVSGNNNIIIGYQADASTSSTSNEITLGDANINHLRIPGIGVTFATSGNHISGITTFSGIIDAAAGIGSTAITLSNSHKMTFGSANELEMYHDGSQSYIKQRYFAYPSALNIISENSNINIMSGSGGNMHGGYENAITCSNNGPVKLYWGGNLAFQTEGYGASVNGSLLINMGQLRIQDEIRHDGDSDTKIRFPANDQISFETGGTNRLKIHTYSSNNHVELDASTHLSLADNGSNGRFIYMGDANASSTGYMHLQPGAGSQGFGGGIRLYSHANSTNPGGVYIGKSLNSSGSIIFGNGGMTPSSEYLRITSGGHTLPGGNGANDLGANVNNRWRNIYGQTLSLTSYATVGSIVAADPGSAYYAYNNRIGGGLAVTGTTRLFGNVGIGTDNPTDILDINSDSASAVTNMYLRNHANLGGAALNIWTQGTYASPQYKAIIGCSDAGGNIRMGSSSNHDLLLLTNNTPRVTITTDGKVLVGSSSITPSRNLDVRGSGHQQILLGSTNNAGVSLMLDGHGGGDGSGGNYATVEMGSDGNLDIRNYDPAKSIIFGTGSNTGSNDRVTIESDGRTTISNAELRITSNAAYTTHMNYQNGGLNYISTSNGGATYFRGSSNNITALTVKGDGEVELNTANYKFTENNFLSMSAATVNAATAQFTNAMTSLQGSYHSSNNSDGIMDFTDYKASDWNILDVYGRVNPNRGGSGAYSDPFFMTIYKGVGYTYPNVVTVIFAVMHTPAARTMYSSGTGSSGNDGITAVWYNGSSESREFTYNNSNMAANYLRIKVPTSSFNPTHGHGFTARIFKRF